MNLRDLRATLIIEIKTLRARYNELKGLSVKNKEDLLKEITLQGTRKKNELRALPAFQSLFVLKNANENQLHQEISELILWLADQMNINKNLNASQVLNLAIMISEANGSLTLEDIAVCFKNGLNGAYGDVYDRLDAQVINKWIREYKKELQQRIFERNQQVHASNRGNSFDDRSSFKNDDQIRAVKIELLKKKTKK